MCQEHWRTWRVGILEVLQQHRASHSNVPEPSSLRIPTSRGELSLSEQTPAGTSVTPLKREVIPELLATRFSLPGFTLTEDGRLALTSAG